MALAMAVQSSALKARLEQKAVVRPNEFVTPEPCRRCGVGSVPGLARIILLVIMVSIADAQDTVFSGPCAVDPNLSLLARCIDSPNWFSGPTTPKTQLATPPSPPPMPLLSSPPPSPPPPSPPPPSPSPPQPRLRLLISSASVNVQALITVPNPPTGTAPNVPTANLAATVLAAATALTSQPAAALSVALAVTVTQAPAITVAENVAVPMVVAPPPPSSPSGSALDDVLSNLGSIQMATSTQTVIVISVVAGVCVLAIAIYLCR
eukprot:jgi/Chrpa1/24255/Chrysochromulina_OHIO_Genome00022950-RA